MSKADKLNKSHLMYHHTPFSACGLYVGDHQKMIQAFKLEQTSCKKCLNKWEEYKRITITEEKKSIQRRALG